jgi:hypothetical protein
MSLVVRRHSVLALVAVFVPLAGRASLDAPHRVPIRRPGDEGL